MATQSGEGRRRRNSGPRDATGRKAEVLETQAAEEQVRKDQEMAMATAAAEEARSTPIEVELEGPGRTKVQPVTEVLEVDDDAALDDDELLERYASTSDESERESIRERLSRRLLMARRATTDDVVVLKDGRRRFKASEDIDQMTFGKDPVTGELRVFSFVMGQEYTVPAELFEHLDEKGLVYH